MNDVTMKELKIVVERAVRPVRATTARKRKMREELLAHLMAIFEEELGRLGSERDALDQSRRRFGDPRELSLQIQETIPRMNRIAAFGDRITDYRRGESALAHAVRVATFMFMSYATTLVVLPPLSWIRGRHGEIGLLAFISLASAACLGGLFFVVTLLGHGIRQAFFSRGKRSYVQGTIYMLLLAFVVPIAGFALAWAATGDPVAGYARLRSLWWSIPVVPAILFAAIWQINRDYRGDDEWASLETEE